MSYVDPMTDPYVRAILARLADDNYFYRDEYDTKSDTARFADPLNFYKAIGFDPVDYANPPLVDVVDSFTPTGLPQTTVNGQPVWIGESNARSYYEGANREADEYADLALTFMEAIDEGQSPFEARKEATKAIEEVRASNPDKFADLDMVDKVLGDIDKYGGDLNTRASTVERGIAREGGNAEQFGLIEGGGPFSSGLGEDPFGYEQGQARGSFADYHGGVDRDAIRNEMIARTAARAQRAVQDTIPDPTTPPLQGTTVQSRPTVNAAGAIPGLGYDVTIPQRQGGDGSNIAGGILAVGQGRAKPQEPNIAPGIAASMPDLAWEPLPEDVDAEANIDAWRELFSTDPTKHGRARRAFQQYQGDVALRPNAGHQELVRRIVAERVRRGETPLPEGRGPRKTVRYNKAEEGTKMKKRD